MTNFQNFVLFGVPVIAVIGGFFYAYKARNIPKHPHHHAAE